MTAEKQAAANRRNAQLSTGPRTSDGKAMASRNGFQGDGTGRQLMLCQELGAEFDALRRAIMAECQPRGAVEAELVDCIIGDFWRRRRAASLETALFDHGEERADAIRELLPRVVAQSERGYARRLYYAFANANNSGGDFGRLARYLAVIDQSLHRNLLTLARLQARRRQREAEGVAGAGDGRPAAEQTDCALDTAGR
jgi:hypothetical protein